MENNIPAKCLYCENFNITEKIITCPFDTNEPHLMGYCFDSPHVDAYGCLPLGKRNPIWINLKTMESWVDGSCCIENNCSNYKPSKYIFTGDVKCL